MKRIKNKDYWELKDLAEMWGLTENYITNRCRHYLEVKEARPTPNIGWGKGAAPLWLKSRLGELNRWKNEYLISDRQFTRKR